MGHLCQGDRLWKLISSRCLARIACPEIFDEPALSVLDVIAREKQIKSWRWSKRIDLIESSNPTWRDLSDDWYEQGCLSCHSE